MITTVIVWWLVIYIPGGNILQVSQNDWPDKITCESMAEQTNRDRGQQPKRFCIPHVKFVLPDPQPTNKSIKPQRTLT